MRRLFFFGLSLVSVFCLQACLNQTDEPNLIIDDPQDELPIDDEEQ